MAAGQGRGARARSSTACCARSPRGCGSVTVLLWPYLPASAERLLDALGAPDLSLAGAELGAGRDRARQPDRVAVPQGPQPAVRAVIDSHTHLDLCEPPDAELVAAAERRGRQAHADRRHRRRLLPRGARRGRGLPPGVRGDRPPPERGAAASTTPTSPSCARWPPTSAAVAIGETRPGLLPRRRPARPTSSARSPRRSRSRARRASRS